MMSMYDNISRELCSLSQDMVSTKVMERNKSVDRLNAMLTSSQDEIFYIMSSNKYNSDITWSTLFSSSVESIVQHSQKLDPGVKGYQTSVNKNSLYASVLHKIVQSSYECKKSKNISTNILYQGILPIIKNRISREHFGKPILYIIEETLFSEKLQILSELRINDYIELLTCIFTMAERSENNLYAALKCTIRGVEFGAKCFQCTHSLFEILECVQKFTQKAEDDERILDSVVKLNLLILKDLIVDGHQKILHYYKDKVELFCRFYKPRIRSETRESLFELYSFFYITYFANKQGKEYLQIDKQYSMNWDKINRKLLCIIEMEIKEKYSSTSGSDERSKVFVKFAAMTIRTIYIMKNFQSIESPESVNGECSNAKLLKTSTSLEDILNLINKNNRIYNQPIWFTILVKFLYFENELIDITSFQLLLNIMMEFSEQNFDILSDIESVRCLIQLLLSKENNFIKTEIFDNLWDKFVIFLLDELNHNADALIVSERQTLLHILIRNGKLNFEICTNIVKSFMEMKRLNSKNNLKTIREMLLTHGTSLITKNGLEDFFQQLYSNTTTNDCSDDNIDDDFLLYLGEVTVILLLNNFDYIDKDSMKNGKTKIFNNTQNENLEIIKNIQLKYMRKFIAIEARKYEKILFKKKVENINYLNEKDFECLLKNSDFQLIDNLNFSDNLNKIIKLLILIENFSKFNIIGSDTETCLLRKKFGLLIQRICNQIKENSNEYILQLGCLKISFIIKKLLVIVIKLKEINLFDYCDQYLTEFTAFLKRIFNCLDNKHNILDWEPELIFEIKSNILKSLAIMTEFNGFRSDTFDIIKNHDLFKTNNIKDNNENNIDVFLDSLYCLINENEFSEQDVPNWILEHLEIICKSHHNDLNISTKIVDILLSICKSFRNFPDNVVDIFVILSSFLKICYKSKFNANFNVKVILLFKDIAKIYPDLVINNEEIQELYTSRIGKFFSSSSLNVKFSVVECVSYLLDPTWLCETSVISDKYIEFSRNLYSSINWITLLNSNDEDDLMISSDEKLNIHSSIIQLFFALFGFSYLNNHLGFLELADFCKNNNIKENFFQNRHILQFSEYFNCEFQYLSAESCENLISFWIKQNFKLGEMPWFICCENEKTFYEENLEAFIFTALKNSEKYISEITKKINAKTEVILKKFLEKCYAFILPYSLKFVTENSDYVSINSEYIQEVNNLLKNLKNYNINLNSISNSLELHKIAYSALSQFSDNNKFLELINFKTHFSSLDNFNFEILEKILCNLTKKTMNFANFAKNNSHVIVQLNEKLKWKIFKTKFIKEKLLWICRYLTIIDLLDIKEIENDINWFFAKDVICFVSSILRNFQNIYLIFKAAIYFIENFLKNLITWSDQLEDEFFEIINQIIEIAENNNENNNKLRICLSFLENLFCWIIESKNQLLNRIEPLMEKNIFKGTSIEIHNSKLPPVTRKTILEDLHEFVSTKTKNSYVISKLSLNISKKKKDFIELSQNNENKEYVRKILNILIEIIVNGSDKEVKSAAECLGTIGPIFISKYAFPNENENSIATQSDDVFQKRAVKAMEKIIFSYNPKSYSFVLSVANVLANSETFKIYTINQRFLKPFFKTKSSSINDLEFLLRDQIDLKRFLCENANQSNFDIFLQDLTSKLFKNLKLLEFEKLSSECYQFDELIILPLIKILLENSQGFQNILVDMLEYFYSEANIAIINYNQLKKNYLNKRTIKLMLDITELYRIHNNFSISINLLNVANVAAYQQASFFAIFYLELWALNERNKSGFTISNNELIKNKIFQKIALHTYKAIDCKDAIKGFLNPLESQIEYYNNNNDWMEVLIEMDASNHLHDSQFLMEILKRNGLLTLSTTLQNDTNSIQNEVDYEIYWRLGNWNIPTSSHSNVKTTNENYLENLENQFERNHYEALKAIKDKDETNALRSIKIAKEIIIRILKESSLESMQNFYKHLTNLMLLRQIEEFSKIQFFGSGSSNSMITHDSILSNWDLEFNMRYGNFQNKERTMAQKIVLFELSGTRAERKISEYYSGSNVVAKYLLNMVETCNNINLPENIYLAKRYLSKLKNLSNIDEETKCRTDLINANICIKNGRKSMALAILHNKIKEPSTQHSILYRFEAYRLLGKYLAENNDETFDEINKNYFQKAKNLEKIEELLANGTLKDINKNFYNNIRKNFYKNVAEYSDREYQQIESHMKSDDFQRSVEIIKKHRDEAKIIKQNTNRSVPDYKTNMECCAVLERNANLDAHNIEYFEKSHQKYLELALTNYIAYCRMDDAIQSSAIYRIIGLWFSNKNNEKINEIIEKSEIPSYKFINVLSQLTAQLNSKEIKFVEILKNIVIKCAVEHPHHTLSHIICLHTANEDLQYFGQKKSKSANSDLRLQRVKEILDTLRNNKRCSEIIVQMHQMFINLIECAYLNMQKSDLNTIVIKNYNISEKLQKMKHLDKIHCPTVHLDIQPIVNENLNQEIININGWDSKYEPLGGINAPKKIYCNCSDGVKRLQLLKGNDDLRQDAIMQQVLTFVNSLLTQNNENLDLTVRTYKVVPLSKRSGLLEWCTNTTTLSQYLSGKNKSSGAHAKYRPEDKRPIECRSILVKYKEESRDIRIKVFKEICQTIQPVLHYFFFERFKTPSVWFERRLAYMNSVATTSMIGYILGLGDRHCQNILLDEKTAEVIHIDFGIAFEKGKAMPTPETVPFRLTREMVAPMGICEVNGVFKNSCEQTLQILRDNHQVLLTILEVLLYDPLYSWSLNEKILKRINEESGGTLNLNENSEDNTKNSSAHRALMQVQNKLEGRSDKQIGSVSVSTQVEKLISEARSVINLALLFPGWDQYL